MVTLEFVLSPDGCIKFHDALLCLSRFSDLVSIEASDAQLALTALNSSKSAHASIVFHANDFFSSYKFASDVQSLRGHFNICVLNKALLSIFKGRVIDVRSRDSNVERCVISVVEGPNTVECRLIVKIVCSHGVTKTYKLIYEPVEIMHALFDKHRATSYWSISARQLKEFTEYFAPKTEQLDMYSENGKMALTSYTEKSANGRDVLKQSLQTSISIDTQDFDEFNVPNGVHVIIGVKDFRHIVAHADTLRSNVRVMYSQPPRPLQIVYGYQGIHCEFTLMTIGDLHASTTSTASKASTHSVSRPNVSAKVQKETSSKMLPPPKYTERRILHRQEQSNRAPEAQLHQGSRLSAEEESRLFVSADEEDNKWDPAELQNEEDNDILGWDASATYDETFTPLLRDSGMSSRSQTLPSAYARVSAIAPTQRASQVRGLFD